MLTGQAADVLGALRVPLIAAPMTGVSNLELMRAATAAGIAGSFPLHNAGAPEELDRWLGVLRDEATEPDRRPVLPNLIVHRSNAALAEQVATVIRHEVPGVITSVGSPVDVVAPLHDAGILVFADVASMRHADCALAAGADGLVLLTAGAGGQTGWANPLVFARSVRASWDGPLVLAGGVVDGTSLRAAVVAGFDLAYMGTAFIATAESGASPEYKAAVVAASMDDIELTDAYTGLPSSMIRVVDTADGRAPDKPVTFDAAVLDRPRDERAASTPRFSAGHSAGGVDAVVDVAVLVERVERGYFAAVTGTR
jgi:nitronate monooxygenase